MLIANTGSVLKICQKTHKKYVQRSQRSFKKSVQKNLSKKSVKKSFKKYLKHCLFFAKHVRPKFEYFKADRVLAMTIQSIAYIFRF